MSTARVKSSRAVVLRKDTVVYGAKLVPGGKGSHKGKGMEIRLKSKTWKTVARQRDQMENLIETYGAAVAKSRRLGKSVSFVVRIVAGGEPDFHPLEDESPLEAVSATGGSEGELRAALAAARERGQLRVADILSGPDMLSAEEFADLIGTSRVTVNAKRQNHRVLGLEGAKRGFRFPKWQIGEDGKPFSALPGLFDRLGSSWAVYRFLVQHHPELDGLTGQEALSGGRTAEALEVAESVVRAAS